MGYRTYIGYMPKKTYNKIKRFTPDELYQHYNKTGEDRYIGVYEYGTALYEFGKYTDFNPPKKSHKNFFTKKETQARYQEYEFQIITKEFLEYIIQSYNNMIQKYYNDMMMPLLGTEECKPSEFMKSIKRSGYFDNPNITFDFTKITQEESNALYKIIEHVRSFNPEWTDLTPYNLNTDEAITTSWKYEYAIFELVRIYKSFDWKRNQMYYYGY